MLLEGGGGGKPSTWRSGARWGYGGFIRAGMLGVLWFSGVYKRCFAALCKVQSSASIDNESTTKSVIQGYYENDT